MSKHPEPRVWIDVTADTQVMIDAGGRPPGAVMPAGDWEWTVCFPTWNDAAIFADKLFRLLSDHTLGNARKSIEAMRQTAPDVPTIADSIKRIPNTLPSFGSPSTIAFPNANASPPCAPTSFDPVVLINGVVTPLPLFGAQRLETAPFSSVVPIACDENDDLTVAELAEIDGRIPPSSMDSLQATAAAAVPPIAVTLRPATWRDRKPLL